MSNSSTVQQESKKHAGIPESRVSNTDFLQTLGEIYKCNICFNIMINPADCDKCGHSYCFECISNFPCPYNCGTPSSKPKPSSVAIKILLNQIIFTCSYEGCTQALSYNNILLHDQDCEFKPTKCPSPNCGMNVPKKFLEKHMKEDCGFVIEKCKFCSNEFLRQELIEHQENCEAIYNSFTQDKITSDKERSNSNNRLSSNKYIEALNFNIVKIIREHETKYKSLEEENNKIKLEITTGVENIWQKMKEEKKEEANQNISNIQLESTLKQNLSDALKNNLNDVLLSKIKEMFHSNQKIIKDYFENYHNKIGFDCLPNQFSSVSDGKLNEDVITLLKNSLSLTEQNITKSLTEKTALVVNELRSFNEVDIKLTSLNTLLLSKETQTAALSSSFLDKLNLSENKNEILITEAKQLITAKLEDITSKIVELITLSNQNNHYDKLKEDLSASPVSSEPKEEFDINKLTSHFIKNVIEIVEDKNETFKEIIEGEVNKVKENLEKNLDKLYEEVQNTKTELESINKNTKNLSKIISEEISEVVDIINSKNEEKEKEKNESKTKTEECTCGRLVKIEEMLTDLINENSHHEKKEENPNLSEEKIDSKLKVLENRLMTNFDSRLKEMYDLKWCNECEKVDYFYGFIKCTICRKETCKQCVLLCKTCKKLYCKKCVQCPKCGDFSCLHCRISCVSCSVSKGDKFCLNCITDCTHCKRQTCQECIKQCISCKNMSCVDCSKFCRICSKSSCKKCETSKNFRTCYDCQQTSCIECAVTCTMCELEICKTCFLLCKRCKKLTCKKCSIECAMCLDSYCANCSKEFQQNKCGICKKTHCTSCVKNFRKCKVCKEAACKDCHAQCHKCKNFFCNTCNLNCDNCNVYTCSSCVYKCVCDNLIFCEKCLFNVNPIGPHDCVLWMNNSPDFTGIKSRSKMPLPKNFEAKLYLDRFETENLLVGLTDNNTFDEDSVSFVDNIWAFKVKTGQKYSSKKSLEPYYERGTREKDFIIIAVKNDNLYFRVNFDENPPAYNLPAGKTFYLYVENDDISFKTVKVIFVYIRKI